MNIRKVIRRGLLIALTIVAVWMGTFYYTTVYRWQKYTPTVDAFLERGVHADTAALLRASTDSAPVRRTLATPPLTLERLRRSLRPRFGVALGDTVVIAYATRVTVCQVGGGTFDPYQVRLVRQDTTWLVAFAGFGPC